MTTIEHTPGPWQQDGQFIVAPDPEGIHPDIYIAEIAEEDSEGRVASSEQQKANSLLIAAAPELLAACQKVIDYWEHGNLAEALRICHAAVALATDDRPVRFRFYSVLLLFPNYANDSGTETYYTFVEALNPSEAVFLARLKAAAAQQDMEMKPDDFVPLLMTSGHHASEPIFNR